MLIFNHQSMPTFLKVQAINIQTLPNVTTNLRAIVGSSGRLASKSSLGEKLITCDVVVVIPNGKTLQSCARELAGWLQGDGFKPSPLVITDDPDIQYKALVNNALELSDLLFVGTGSIEFVIPSGDSETTKELTKTGGKELTIQNNGTKATYPRIEVSVGTTVTNSALVIQNATTGEKIVLNGSFNAGDVVLVDCDRHLVKRGAESLLKMTDLQSQFFKLKVGSNTLQVLNEGATLSVTYREKFL